ncbi:uncharacterized protein [Haliotis cracherodii]|uniref:uncharacterized protein isoform X2 n=1 Tax=Haliotis cracherodii TaxID=6455 RepID=UPI0039EC2521
MPKKKNSNQQCLDCNKWFVDLNNHKKCDGRRQSVSRSSSDDKQQCPDCNKWFVDLNKHKKCDGRRQSVSRSSSDDKEQCPDCNKWFVDLNNHKKCDGRRQLVSRSSSDDKEQCPDCNKWFVDLNNHKKCDGRRQSVSRSSSDDKQQCPDCNKWFVDLNKHKKCDGRRQSVSPCSSDDKEQCPDCNKWFVDLNKHKKCDGRRQSVSPCSSDDKEQCPDCNKWFVDLNKHKKCDGRRQSVSRSSSDDKEQCPDCNKWFVDLNNHKKCDGRGCSGMPLDDKRSLCVHTTPLSFCSPTRMTTSWQHRTNSNRMDRDAVSTMEDIVRNMVDTGILEHSRNPRTEISKFFEDEVSLKQNEIENTAEVFNNLQNNICDFLESKTHWKWTTFRGGSYYDKTKVSRPNEMDCLFIPKVDSDLQPVYEDCHPGYCKVRVVNASPSLNFLCDNSFINAEKYRNFFFELMDKYIRHNSKCRALNIPHWPQPSIARDLRKTLPKGISPSINVTDIMEKGFNITTKRCPGDQPDRLQWQMSFSLAEQKLTLHGDTESWKPILRTIKRVMEIAKGQKGLMVTGKSEMIHEVAQHTRKHYFRDDSFRLCFTTYHIRTLMWTLLYDLTAGSHVWREDTRESRLHFSLGKLKKMLTGEMRVPHFFLPAVGDMMSTVRWRDREFMYILVRATEILFSRSTDRYS